MFYTLDYETNVVTSNVISLIITFQKTQFARAVVTLKVPNISFPMLTLCIETNWLKFRTDFTLLMLTYQNQDLLNMMTRLTDQQFLLFIPIFKALRHLGSTFLQFSQLNIFLLVITHLFVFFSFKFGKEFFLFLLSPYLIYVYTLRIMKFVDIIYLS